MRPFYFTILISFLSLLFSCHNPKLESSNVENSDSPNATNQIENTEVFSLINPINTSEEPFYKTIYDGYSISMQSNDSFQTLIFKKGDNEFSRPLKFYYENPEIVFHLYKSNLGNNIIFIEGRDYYSSNLGIYYYDTNSNDLIKVDDTLRYIQDDPETKGFKQPKAEIIKKGNNLKCKIYLGDSLLYDKNYDILSIENTNSGTKNPNSGKSWDGTYEGTFLRLKEEYADPRAYGKLTLIMNDQKGTLQMNAYDKIVDINLAVIQESANEAKLKEITGDKTLTLSKKLDKIYLEGNLLDSIVGEKEKYELEKIQ